MSETMTNEEAITKLTNIMHDDHYAWHPSILTAFSMAVDALRGAEAQLTQANTSNALKAMDCISRQAVRLIESDSDAYPEEWNNDYEVGFTDALNKVLALPSAQPETAKRIVGKSRDGMTLWYQCDMCNEPVDAQDNFCRGCGRRLTDG